MMHNYSGVPMEVYEQELPDSLRSLELGEEDEQALVAALHGLALSAQSGPAQRSLVSLLSVARPALAIVPVLDLLMRRREEGWSPEWPDSYEWSILYALERALDVFYLDPDERFYADARVVAATLREHDPRAALDELAEMPNEPLADIAQNVRAIVDASIVQQGCGSSGLQ